MHTDRPRAYPSVGPEFSDHNVVKHFIGEYVRGDVSTNAAEDYFLQLKQSIDGTRHAVSRERLHCYLAEFDYRYSTRHCDDSTRTRNLMFHTSGRRPLYRPLTKS